MGVATMLIDAAVVEASPGVVLTSSRSGKKCTKSVASQWIGKSTSRSGTAFFGSVVHVVLMEFHFIASSAAAIAEADVK